MCSARVVAGTSYPPSTHTPWREGPAAGLDVACALVLPRLCYPPSPLPPPPVHPPFHIPIPHPTHLTPHLLLSSEQSQPAVACAILCLVSNNRQRTAAYKYPASPRLAAAFPNLDPSTVSVSASGTARPLHGPHHQALGCDRETDICCSIDTAKCPPRSPPIRSLPPSFASLQSPTYSSNCPTRSRSRSRSRLPRGLEARPRRSGLDPDACA